MKELRVFLIGIKRLRLRLKDVEPMITLTAKCSQSTEGEVVNDSGKGIKENFINKVLFELGSKL